MTSSCILISRHDHVLIFMSIYLQSHNGMHSVYYSNQPHDIRCLVNICVNNSTLYSNIAATCLGCKQPSSVIALRHKQIANPYTVISVTMGAHTVTHNFYFPHNIQIGSGAHPASHPMVKQPHCDASPHIHLVRRLINGAAVTFSSTCRDVVQRDILPFTFIKITIFPHVLHSNNVTTYNTSALHT